MRLSVTLKIYIYAMNYEVILRGQRSKLLKMMYL